MVLLSKPRRPPSVDLVRVATSRTAARVFVFLAMQTPMSMTMASTMQRIVVMVGALPLTFEGSGAAPAI